jgi:predicted nucleic acid-binding protein
MIVVDASIIVTALADDGPDGDRVRRRLRGERLVAPHLIDVETTSAWRRLAATGALDDRRVRLAIDDLLALRLTRVSHVPFVHRCWQLRETITMYDAVYVAVAEALEATLLTADGKLAGAPGPRCEIELVS